MENYKIEIYTDGSCIGNGTAQGYGGWAYVIRFLDKNIEIQEARYEPPTITNSRLEILAIINALEKLKEKNTENKPAVLFCDSEYVVKGASAWMHKWESMGWKRRRNPNNPKSVIAHVDLWKRLYDLNSCLNVEYQWIRGHNGNKYNEICDDLAYVAGTSKENYYKQIRGVR